MGLEARGEAGVRCNQSKYEPILPTPKCEAFLSQFSKDSGMHVWRREGES